MLEQSIEQSLEQSLDHRFADRELLQQALTRRGANGDQGTRAPDNERLEFLGDAVLGLVIAAELYQRFPDAQESDLTRARSAMVRRETLAVVGAELNLQDYIVVPSGDAVASRAARESMVGDTVEALFGALYLEGGLKLARRTILRLFAGRLEQHPGQFLKDPKTLLQEWLQGCARSLPEYVIADQSGSDHEPSFTVRVRLADTGETAHGKGTSRRRAEQVAAAALLEVLGVTGG